MRTQRLLGVAACLLLTLSACTGNGGASPGSSGNGTGAESSAAGGGTTGPGEPGGSGEPTGSGATGSGGGITKIDASGTLNVMAFGCTTGDEIAKARIKAFKDAYPDVDVKCAEGDFDSQQFLTSVRSGTPPDVVYLDRNTLGTYVANGAISDLSDCVSRTGVDMSGFRQAAVSQVTVDGVVYGIPEFFNTRVLLINNKVAADAGVSVDDIQTQDWDKLKAATAKLFKKSGGDLKVIGFDPKLPEFLPLWSKINGADILSADGRTAQLTDPKVAEALTFARDLIELQAKPADFFAARDAVSADFFGAKNPLATGAEGAFPMEQWYLNVLASNSPDVDLTVKQLTDRSGNPVTYSDGQAWAIPTGAKSADAACAWVSMMTALDTWKQAGQARADAAKASGKPCAGTYTANIAADDAIFNQICPPSGTGTFDKAIQLVLKGQDSAFALAPTPAAKAFDDAWRAAVDKVLNDGADPAQALSDANTQAQSEIDSAGS